MEPETSGAGMGSLNADGDSVTVFLDAATKRLDIQISTHVALDSKLGNVLSVGSAILPITFGLLGLSETDVPHSAAIFLVLAGVAYAALLALSWLTVARTSGMATGAPIGVLREHVAEKEYAGEALRLWVAEEYESSIARNERVLYLHSTYVGRASYALYLESAFLSLAGVVSLLFG
jgi:hypothetical protein